MQPTILHIIDSKPNLTASTICGVLLESSSCPLNNTEFNWTVNIDNGPPVLRDSEDSNETLNIVQITDIHYDPKYEPYGNSDCHEPACCRNGQNKTNISGKVAGYWGDYNLCDSPWHTVVDVLDHIRAQHQVCKRELIPMLFFIILQNCITLWNINLQNISHVYFTGDIVDHGVWETTIEKNIKSLKKTYLKIHETFGNIPVYPIVGNHEPHPVNQ